VGERERSPGREGQDAWGNAKKRFDVILGRMNTEKNRRRRRGGKKGKRMDQVGIQKVKR